MIRIKAGALTLCALWISACAGGAGGAAVVPAPTITLAPTSVTATFVAGTSTQLSVVATATAQLTGALYVDIKDPDGVLQSTATLTPGAQDSYSVNLMTSPKLAAGHFAGSFQVSICHDQGCAQPVAGSPASVAF